MVLSVLVLSLMRQLPPEPNGSWFLTKLVWRTCGLVRWFDLTVLMSWLSMVPLPFTLCIEATLVVRPSMAWPRLRRLRTLQRLGISALFLLLIRILGFALMVLIGRMLSTW